MKKFLRYFLFSMAFLLAIYILGGMLISPKWIVKKTINISAEPQIVYSEIANLKNWQNWSPWTKDMDPDQSYSYEGPNEGEGAKWSWESKKMGSGWLEIKNANPNWGMDYNLFIDMEGRKSTLYGKISYQNEGDKLVVHWEDQGESNSLAEKWMSLLIKSMLGKEMTKGLEKLKLITEGSPKEEPSDN